MNTALINALKSGNSKVSIFLMENGADWKVCTKVSKKNILDDLFPSS